MAEKKRNNLILFYKLTWSSVLIPGLFSLFLVIFYITGNFQGFQDSTQYLVLSSLGITSVFFAIFSVLGLIFSIIVFFIKGIVSKKRNLLNFFLMIFCVLCSVAFISLSLLLRFVSEGM